MAIAGINHLWLGLFLLMPILAVSFSADPEQCVYTLYIRTSSVPKANTDSKITATFFDTQGYGLEIGDVKSWGGLMGGNYQYFKRGSVDIFSNKAPCLTAPICALNLTSDGSGANHGWFCNDVDLTVAHNGKSCERQTFIVEQWLATDQIPYELSTFRDYCDFSVTGKRSGASHSVVAKI